MEITNQENKVKWELLFKIGEEEKSIEAFKNFIRSGKNIAGVLKIIVKASATVQQALKNYENHEIKLLIDDRELYPDNSPKIHSINKPGKNQKLFEIVWEFSFYKGTYSFSKIFVVLRKGNEEIKIPFDFVQQIFLNYSGDTVDTLCISPFTTETTKITDSTVTQSYTYEIINENIIASSEITVNNTKKLLVLARIPSGQLCWGTYLGEKYGGNNNKMFFIYPALDLSNQKVLRSGFYVHPVNGEEYTEEKEIILKRIKATLDYDNDLYTVPFGFAISQKAESLLSDLIKRTHQKCQKLDDFIKELINITFPHLYSITSGNPSPEILFLIVLDPEKFTYINDYKNKSLDINFRLVILKNYEPQKGSNEEIEKVSLKNKDLVLTNKYITLSFKANYEKVNQIFKALQNLSLENIVNLRQKLVEQLNNKKDLMDSLDYLDSQMKTIFSKEKVEENYSKNKFTYFTYKVMYGGDDGIGVVIDRLLSDYFALNFDEKNSIIELTKNIGLENTSCVINLYEFSAGNNSIIIDAAPKSEEESIIKYSVDFKSEKLIIKTTPEKTIKEQVVKSLSGDNISSSDINVRGWVAITLDLSRMENHSKSSEDKIKELLIGLLVFTDKYTFYRVNSFNLFYEIPWILVDANFKFLIKKVLSENYLYYDPFELLTGQSGMEIDLNEIKRRALKEANKMNNAFLGVNFLTAWDDHPFEKKRVNRLIELFSENGFNINATNVSEFLDRINESTIFLWKKKEIDGSSRMAEIIGWELFDKASEFIAGIRRALNIFKFN